MNTESHEPLCIWISCTNRSELFSRTYGIHVCSSQCLDSYTEFKEGKGIAMDLGKLWYLHISLWQQIFYERIEHGKTGTLILLEKELAFVNGKIAEMGSSPEIVVILRKNLEKQTERMIAILQEGENEERKKRWVKEQENLLKILQAVTPESVELMNEYRRYFLLLLEQIRSRNDDQYCTFKHLTVIVFNLAENIQRQMLDQAQLSQEKEVATMMMRPENGRISRQRK